MLTRLEIDGFKNLFDISIDFGPYTCIAGANAVGKSNIFDAIEFIALLADYPFMEASQRIRSAGDRLGDPSALFYNLDAQAHPMRFAAEMIVPNRVLDDFGQEAVPTSTFLRYELELRYEPPASSQRGRLGSIRLETETLNYINKGDARTHLKWPHSPKFRDALISNNRYGTGYISTEPDPSGGNIIQVHQDGGSRGKPRTTRRTQRTTISTTTSSDDPTILAARREMQQWRKLALEPSAMRSPDAVTDSDQIGSNGSHLPSALYRLTDKDPDARARVASSASALTDVRDVEVEYNAARDTLTLLAKLGDGPYLPARALSEGTLRFLALSIIEADDEFGGLICMEEPENGIHPARIESMVELLRGLASDSSVAPEAGEPIRQVMVNTHSPRFVSLQDPSELILAIPRLVRKDGRDIETVELVPMSRTWRTAEGAFSGSKALIADYLVQPPGTLAELDYPEREIRVLD